MKKRAKSEYDFKRESRIFVVVMVIVLILILTAGVMDSCGVFNKEEEVWKPTVSYPMANAHISWVQTFYDGNGDGMYGH